MPAEAPTKATLLVHETKDEFAYNREHALRVWHALVPLIPEGDDRGYTEYENLTDDGRIVLLFELTAESTFGDMVFGSLANYSCGSTLVERSEDE